MDWDLVRCTMEALIAGSETELSSEMAQCVVDIIEVCRINCEAPTSVGLGYLPTIRLSWSGATPAPIEVEIFPDRYEFYAFSEEQTDIRHFAHCSGGPVSAELMQLLQTAIGRS